MSSIWSLSFKVRDGCQKRRATVQSNNTPHGDRSGGTPHHLIESSQGMQAFACFRAHKANKSGWKVGNPSVQTLKNRGSPFEKSYKEGFISVFACSHVHFRLG